MLIPHEYYECVREELHPTRAQLGRTIAFCTEQPGTHWFDLTRAHAASAGAAVDIYPDAVRALARAGVDAEHFRLGYSGFWDRWHRDESAERPVDVLHLGAVNARRLRALAGFAGTLWPHRTRLLIPPEKPKTRERADFLLGEAKWDCLRSAKILLNLHRQESAYFEWVRVLEGLSNGCVLVSEHSPDCAASRSRRALRLGDARESGAARRPSAAGRGAAGGDAPRGLRPPAAELPMRPAAERLIAMAEDLARATGTSSEAGSDLAARRPTPRHRLRSFLRSGPDARLDGLYERQWSLGEWSRRSDAVLKRLVIGQIELNRRLAAQEVALRNEDPAEVRVVARTPAYARSKPRVSVLIPLYNHDEEVGSALESVASSELERLEVVVLDDASTDRSQEAVLDFFAEHTHLPGMLLQHVVNRGLGRTRNDLVAAARGEFVFMLDADNEIYPTALDRLVDALDEDSGAFFVYPMLEEHVDGEPDTLRSFLPGSRASSPRRTTSTRCRCCVARSSSSWAATRRIRACTGGRTTTSGAGPPSAVCEAFWSPRSWRATAARRTRCSTRSPTSTRRRPSRSSRRGTRLARTPDSTWTNADALTDSSHG